jgi:hypothetical protein
VRPPGQATSAPARNRLLKTRFVSEDAYLSQEYLGNILRYLKCCKLNADGSSSGNPRYPNLQQVFITSRTYGGYGNGTQYGCLMPEPFAYEEGFAVQDAIVDQISQDVLVGDPAPYIGLVDYQSDGSGHAPWFDWGPYLWASKDTPRSDGLFWYNGQGSPSPCIGNRDVRYGDLTDQTDFWGDFTHPTAQGENKAANQLVKWITGGNLGSQSYISNWVTPWIAKH